MPTDAEKVAWYDAHFAIPKGPFRDCKGPPFNSEHERVVGGGLDLVTSDVFVKSAVWRCRELAAEVERRNEEIDAMHDLDVARFRTLRRDVDQIKRALQRQGVDRG